MIFQDILISSLDKKNWNNSTVFNMEIFHRGIESCFINFPIRLHTEFSLKISIFPYFLISPKKQVKKLSHTI